MQMKTNFISQEEVSELVIKAQNGNKKAAEYIVNSYQRYIFYVAKKYGMLKKGFCKELEEEIISAGNMGLFDSIRRFNVSKGAPFISCAEYGIRNSLNRYFQKVKEKNQELKDSSFFDSFTNETQKSIELEYEENEERQILKKLLHSLTPKEQFVIKNHYGLYGKELTFSEIAEKLSLTKQRCQQIEKIALRKMKDEAELYVGNLTCATRKTSA